MSARFAIYGLVWAGLLSGSGISEPRLSGPWSEFGEWVDGGRRFVVLKNPDTDLRLFEHKLVMVSFKPGSEFGQQLSQKPTTLAYYSSRANNTGRAIVIVDSMDERQKLAGAAHDDIGACGAIEEYDPAFQLTSLSDAASPVIATTAKSSSVNDLLGQISTSNLSSTVSTLVNLGTRYHAGGSPNAATTTIQSLWQANSPAGSSVSLVDHLSSKSTSQKSVVLSIPGTSDTAKTVVLGAHLDSINRSDQTQAPGADDNASGIAALTEILRVIKAANATFSRNIEIHAYAAEEAGLLGSADIAATASASAKNITAMLQLDMIGYSATSGDQTLHLITTDTSPVLVRHLKDLISLYLGGTWATGSLSAGTSDHKSWVTRGFHGAFAFEHPTNYNHTLHSTSDTAANIDFSLASRFTKLALAFLAHEAGLSSAVTDTADTWTSQKQTDDAVKFAISASSTGGFRVAAAVSGAATTAEFCKVSSGDSTGCQSMNTETTLGKQASGRSFFVTTADVAIAEDDLWRLNAYNSQGELVGTRTVKLKKNS